LQSRGEEAVSRTIDRLRKEPASAKNPADEEILWHIWEKKDTNHREPRKKEAPPRESGRVTCTGINGSIPGGIDGENFAIRTADCSHPLPPIAV